MTAMIPGDDCETRLSGTPQEHLDEILRRMTAIKADLPTPLIEGAWEIEELVKRFKTELEGQG